MDINGNSFTNIQKTNSAFEYSELNILSYDMNEYSMRTFYHFIFWIFRAEYSQMNIQYCSIDEYSSRNVRGL